MIVLVRRILLVASVVLLIAAAPVGAATSYCVNSQSTLQSALNDAEDDADNSIIKVRSGVINLTSDLQYAPTAEFILPAGSLTVRGGYNSDCSAYSVASGATTITGGSTEKLTFVTQTGSVSLLGLTLQGTHVALYSQALGDCLSNDPKFTLRRLRVDVASVEVISQCHDVLVDNSLFTNGVGAPGAGLPAGIALGVYLFDYEDVRIGTGTIINSSFINSRIDFSSCCDLQAVVFIYNSIFDRPAGSDIFSNAVNIAAFNNRYDAIAFNSGGGHLVGSPVNTITGVAQLNAQYVPNPGSPMIDSGTNSVPDGVSSVDQAGGDRIIGSGVDRGALESPVDGTGVFTVTSSASSGAGSLAAAMDLANADPGNNTIKFSIAGSCPRRINLAAPLQVRETVTFDGWSQPGSVKNTEDFGFDAIPCVLLDGNDSIAVAIETLGDLGAGQVLVNGLAFEGFNSAVLLAFGEDHVLRGNQFGGRIGSAGPVLTGNGDAITVAGGGSTFIGGANANARNLIGGSTGSGILITGAAADENQIINNLIGLDKNGGSALPNLDGIRINTDSNRVIENRIGGNTRDGIVIRGSGSHHNLVSNNEIGGNALVVGNGRMGVFIELDSYNNTIGPNNIMRENGDSAVRVMPTAAGHNRITANRIFDNDSPGIDLGNDGVTANSFDPQFCNPTTGCAANREQNFPVLIDALRLTTSIHPVNKPVRIEGRLTSVIGGPYRIEFFSDNSCYIQGYGQGANYLGSIDLTVANAGICSSGNCQASFTIHLPQIGLAVGDVITATATSAAGDTSEFSECIVLQTETSPTTDAIFKNGFEN